MSFYKEHYDVVIIGGALAGLSCALQLQQKGIKDILILEKHNLPGGLATSYVRNGIEIEATLHEMMSIGTKEDRLKVGVFFDEVGVDIDWLRVPEAYRFVRTAPEGGKPIDITLPTFITRTVVETEPGARGDTASSNVMKPAKLDNGYELMVPLFINQGDLIKVDTRTGEYAERVSKG